MTFLKIVLFAIILVALAWVAIAIKMFLKKNGQFQKACSTVDPKTGKPLACTCLNNTSDVCENSPKPSSGG